MGQSTRNFFNPPALPSWPSFFTQVVTVEGGQHTLVFISGQVGVDVSKQLVGDGSFAAQVEQAFLNLTAALAAAGASMHDVTKLTIYVVNYSPAHAEPIGHAIRKHFAAEKLPACTLLGVQALADPRFLIEAYAVVSSPNAPS